MAWSDFLSRFFRRSNAPANSDERGNSPADEWVYGGFWLFVGSSDVSEIMYDADKQYLYIKFISNRRAVGKSNVGYYLNVTPSQARAFYLSDSPGRSVWKLRASGFDWVYLTSVNDPSLPQKPQVIRQVSPFEP